MEYSRQQVQPQVIIASTNTTVSNTDAFKGSAQKQMRVLAIIQIVTGFLGLVFGIAIAIPWCRLCGGLSFYGNGIWTGAYFIVVGGISLKTSIANRGNWIIASMVLNIISTSLFCSVAVGLSATSVSYAKYYAHWSGVQGSALLALDCLLLIMAVAQFVITIWSAVLCCGAVCRCCKPQAGTLVTYNQQPQPLIYQGSTTIQGQLMAVPVQYMQGQPMAVPVQHMQGQPMALPVQHMQGQPMALPVQHMQGQPMALPVGLQHVNPVGAHQQSAMYMVQAQEPPSY